MHKQTFLFFFNDILNKLWLLCVNQLIAFYTFSEHCLVPMYIFAWCSIKIYDHRKRSIVK